MAAMEFEGYKFLIDGMNEGVNTLLDEIHSAYRLHATAHLLGSTIEGVALILKGDDSPEKDNVIEVYESEVLQVPNTAFLGIGDSIMTLCSAYPFAVVVGAIGRLMATYLVAANKLVYEEDTVNPFTALFGDLYGDDFSTNSKGEVIGFNFSDDGTFVIDLSQFGTTSDDDEDQPF